MVVVNIKNRTVFIVLIALAELSIFWLGRFSVEITVLERNSASSHLDTVITSNEQPGITKRKPATYLFIAIMSAPEDVEQRQTIRETWLRLSTKTPELYQYVFPVGTKGINATTLATLHDEQAQFVREGAPDLVLFDDVVEDYRKLTRKTTAAIHYAVENFEFEFLMKVDVDSFVRLGKLLGALRDVAHPRLYWGFLDGRAKPFRRGKWREPEWMLCDRYLPYQLGGGYVLSLALAKYISSNQPLLQYYASEDVAVGAWLAGLDVKYVHDSRFDTEFTSRGCHNEYLVTHKQSAAAMRQLFATIRDAGVLCAPERRTRFSYIYDFSVPPSQCCARRNDSTVP